MKMTIRFFTLSFIAFLFFGCASSNPEYSIYRNGVLVVAEPIGVNRHYEFRFLEKWRISHDWISGPIETKGCMYRGNVFKYLGWIGPLAEDKYGPMFDWMGSVETPVIFIQKPKDIVFSIGGTLHGNFDPYTLGTKGNGSFDRYLPFCSEYIASYGVGIGGYIIKPDSEKKTDFMVDGATAVTINGLNWLRKDTGSTDLQGKFIRDGMSESETWVLKIPDTPHWLIFKLSSDKKSMADDPEKHRVMLEIFYKIIGSVKLEPIIPVVDQSKLVILDDCVRLHPNWAATCQFNNKSIIGDRQPNLQ